MAMLDEQRIEEIVSRVVERLSGGVAEAPGRPAAVHAASKAKLDIPRGTLGVYADPQQAAAAARRGYSNRL